MREGRRGSTARGLPPRWKEARVPDAVCAWLCSAPSSAQERFPAGRAVRGAAARLRGEPGAPLQAVSSSDSKSKSSCEARV